MNISKSSLQDVLSTIAHSDIFLGKIGIDIINNKDKLLSELLAEKNLDKNSVLATLSLLNELGDEDIHWLLEPTSTLINHIKNRYHNHHRLQLPILISLARQVELKNYNNPDCPVGLSDYLNELYEDLLKHMENEEKILFPFLSDKKNMQVFAQVSLAMHNHDHDIHILDKIDELTNKFGLPGDADDLWKKLYVDLKNFKADLLEHIRLENNILFEKCS